MPHRVLPHVGDRRVAISRLAMPVQCGEHLIGPASVLRIPSVVVHIVNCLSRLRAEEVVWRILWDTHVIVPRIHSESDVLWRQTSGTSPIHFVASFSNFCCSSLPSLFHF